MIDTDKYENWTDDFHVWEQYVKDIDYEPDRLLIADAPLLLEEYKRLMHCLRYVGARLFLDANDYRPYDYTKLLEFCMGNTGEPDDLSGKMGAMIQDVIEE